MANASLRPAMSRRAASVPVDLRFALPPEAGRYDVFISPMRENVCWFYMRGWPFLRVEAIVEDGRARWQRVGVVTLRTVRRENLSARRGPGVHAADGRLSRATAA